jgi:hypothetical protein
LICLDWKNPLKDPVATMAGLQTWPTTKLIRQYDNAGERIDKSVSPSVSTMVSSSALMRIRMTAKSRSRQSFRACR